MHRPVSSLLIGSFLFLTASAAHANSSKVTDVRARRALALPGDTLRIDAGESWPYYDGTLKLHSRPGPDSAYVNPGVTFGITDNFDLGFVAPIELKPDGGLEDPRLHVLYQFHRGRVDVGVFGSLRLGVFDYSVLTGGVPVFFHWNDNIRMDVGGFLVMGVGENAFFSVQTPLAFNFNVTRHFFIGAESGVNFNNMFDNAFNVSIPAGGLLGFTAAPGGRTLGDFTARARLRDIEEGVREVDLMLTVELFFDL